MRFVEPAVRVTSGLESPEAALMKLESAGRVCYQSGGSESAEKADAFIRRLVRMGHESVIEHHNITVLVQCSRACAQQWTRHRLASYSMESQRYVDYASAKHGSGEISFVLPRKDSMTGDQVSLLKASLESAERSYSALRAAGVAAEDARAVLPNATATQFFATANLREWRHFIKLRAAPGAQGEIRELAKSLHSQLVAPFPCVFDDIRF